MSTESQTNVPMYLYEQLDNIVIPNPFLSSNDFNNLATNVIDNKLYQGIDYYISRKQHFSTTSTFSASNIIGIQTNDGGGVTLYPNYPPGSNFLNWNGI